MECKVKPDNASVASIFVLIETLWNVKDVWCALCDHLACRINRNIMECKGTEAKTGVEAGEKY